MIGNNVVDNFRLCLTSERLKTFKDWPNDPSWFCTPEKLASAGFHFNPSEDCLDNVCCVFCGKELDGWEPDDDPLSEHKRHSGKCPFLKLKKPFEEMTLVESLKFFNKAVVFLMGRSFDKKIEQFGEKSDEAREEVVTNLSH